jgi:hypothetical protein
VEGDFLGRLNSEEIFQEVGDFGQSSVSFCLGVCEGYVVMVMVMVMGIYSLEVLM